LESGLELPSRSTPAGRCGWSRTLSSFCTLLMLFALLAPASIAADDSSTTFERRKDKEPGIEWVSLFGHSMTFLTVQHSFRWAKEYYTREATMNGPYFGGVGRAYGRLHGWADGDDFLTNYVGHPMQGAVAGYIFSRNDSKYRAVEFGKNLDYWRGKTRAFVFSALYSAQFEAGPISEATVGKIQAYWPQNGFVDWVITPTAGLAWTLAEDSLDKYVARPLEDRIRNPVARALIRGTLNPSRSFANLMTFRLPWYRDNRPGVHEYDPVIHSRLRDTSKALELQPDSEDPFGRKHAQFSLEIPFDFAQMGGLDCAGGGVVAQIPVRGSWDATVNLSGCNLLGLPSNTTGDSLTYMLGMAWSPKNASRTTPHFRLTIGGQRVYFEKLDPERREVLLANGEKGTYYRSVYEEYTESRSASGLAISLSGGVNVGINRAFGLRLASFEYTHSWVDRIEGYDLSNGLKVSTGLIFNVGSW